MPIIIMFIIITTIVYTTTNNTNICIYIYSIAISYLFIKVWLFISAMMARIPNQEEALTFLFMLSFCEPGCGYPIDNLTQLQKKLVLEFTYLGLIYIYNNKSKYFYPSSIIIHLLLYRSSSHSNDTSSIPTEISTSSTSFASSNANFQIIVETNNQVVAYTQNELDLAMLGLFIDIQLRMPNMVYGKITRDKAKAAYKVGIKASQIIDFLVNHAHPVVLASATATLNSNNNSNNYNIAGTNTDISNTMNIKSLIIPQNVADQLLTWEAESFRIHAQDAVVVSYSDMRGFTIIHFRQVSEYLKRTKAIIWENEKKLLMAITPQGAVLLPSYLEDVIKIDTL